MTDYKEVTMPSMDDVPVVSLEDAQPLYDSAPALMAGGAQGVSELSSGTKIVGVPAGSLYQSDNFITGSTGWQIKGDGTAEFQSITARGTITATAGAIGGFNIGSDYVRDVANSFGLASTVTGGDDVRFWAGDTFANRATAPFRITEAGALFASSATIAGYRLFEAVVSTDGNGDYTTIADAITAGKKNIFIRKGTYTITSAITIASSDTTFTGESQTETIIYIDDSANINGIYASTLSRIIIQNLTFDGNQANQSGTSYCIFFYNCDNCIIQNCIIQNGYSSNIYLSNDCGNNTITNNTIKNGRTHGIYFAAVCSGNYIFNNLISGNDNGSNSAGIILFQSPNNTVNGNAVLDNFNGIVTSGSGGFEAVNTISSNLVTSNTNTGISINMAIYTSVVGNVCYANAIGISGGGIYNTITGNTIACSTKQGVFFYGDNSSITANTFFDNGQLTNNTYDDIQLGDASNHALYNVIANNTITATGSGTTNKTKYGIEIFAGSKYNNVVGNVLPSTHGTGKINFANELLDSRGNLYTDITQENELVYMKNTSGGALVEGNAVILKATAAGNEVTTTTTQGDDFVFGSLAENIADNAFGFIKIMGKVTTLKVDGTTDIAIGDYLGTFTTAGIAMKASVGDMAFAIALEAYTNNDSNGILDALLVKPRKI